MMSTLVMMNRTKFLHLHHSDLLLQKDREDIPESLSVSWPHVDHLGFENFVLAGQWVAV